MNAAGRLLADVLDLALPLTCVGCAQPGEAWCRRCLPVAQCSITEHGELTVSAAQEYQGITRTALLAYKERGHRQLAPALADLLAAAVAASLKRQFGRAAADIRPLLVPVPSTRAAARVRGGDHLLRLTIRAARQTAAEVARPLCVGAAVADSAGLSEKQRVANLTGQLTARPPADPRWAGRPALLVDDIVTTGATLNEASRALGDAGWQVIGAAVIAATRRRFPATRRT